jgi:hypothetical protein
MSQMVLPNSINYGEQLPSLMPGVNNYTQVLNPINGSSFTSAGQQIIIDFPSRGFIDPKSIYFSYNMSITTGAAAGSVCRCPLVAPFSRLDLFINSKLVETINDYNIVASLWTELYMGPNEKASIQSGFGYAVAVADQGTLRNYDSRTLFTAGGVNTYQVSGPLLCSMLSGCDKFIPSFATGAIRLVFTIDSVSAYTTRVANEPTAFSISNFQVTYDMIDFGPEIENSIMMSDQIKIKSTGFNQSSVALQVGTQGQQTFVFNQRYASIRNAVLSYSCARDAVFVNGKFDSPDGACGTGNSNSFYSLNIGGQSYPQSGPLSGVNKVAILSELRKATGNLYSWERAMSINNVEFSYAETGANAVTGTALTTATEPAKFYVGFDLNKINSSSQNLLNGVSTANSPINAIVNFGAATTLAKSLNLTLNYDAILVIDPRTKQLDVLQ